MKRQSLDCIYQKAIQQLYFPRHHYSKLSLPSNLALKFIPPKLSFAPTTLALNFLPPKLSFASTPFSYFQLSIVSQSIQILKIKNKKNMMTTCHFPFQHGQLFDCLNLSPHKNPQSDKLRSLVKKFKLAGGLYILAILNQVQQVQSLVFDLSGLLETNMFFHKHSKHTHPS